jgi:outer membrane protein
MITFILVAQLRVLSLSEALATAEVRQPEVRQAEAQVDVARARADAARAPMLPSLSGVASYQRTTANFVARPTQVPLNTPQMPPNGNTFDFFNFGLTLTQLIWDFGYTWGRWRAALSTTEAQRATERATRLGIALRVRAAYFAARAQKSLIEVAKETLANEERHFKQVEGFVRLGARPEIDLAQARTDRANARVQLINAENGYATAKAQLNVTMGVDGPTDFEVGDEELAPVEGEERESEALLADAIAARPELMGLELQIKAQRAALRAQKGAYGPSLGLTTSLTDAGTDITKMGWNWNLTLALNWSIFSGLSNWAAVREAAANLRVIESQRDGFKQSVRLEVEQARLAVRAAKEALAAADEALTAARERLRLAEGRYTAGVGNTIERGDAQLAATNASFQRVQAGYNLATARAQLLKALGRR